MLSKIEITIYIYFNRQFVNFHTKILNNRMVDLFKIHRVTFVIIVNILSVIVSFEQTFIATLMIKLKMLLLYTISACPAGYLPRPSNSGDLQCPVNSYMPPTGNNLKFDSLSLSVNVMFFQSTNYLLVFCMIDLL